jgi:4-hydroxy-2-oxoheptanedioate aldolase
MRPARSLHDRLSTQGALLGLLLTRPDLALTEMASVCGYDFLFLDGEHGVFSEMELLITLQLLSGTGVASMVRLPSHDTRALGRYLDMGADAIAVPNVNTPEQASVLARAMEYPPTGTRGFSASIHRVTQYGVAVEAHLQSPRGHATLWVIIESALGAQNAQEILAVPGVDGAIIGPFDLSADLGQAGDFTRAAYAQALGRVEEAASKHRKMLGTAPHPGYPLETLLAHGHRLFILGADISVLREAMSAQVAQARSRLSSGSCND